MCSHDQDRLRAMKARRDRKEVEALRLAVTPGSAGFQRLVEQLAELELAIEAAQR